MGIRNLEFKPSKEKLIETLITPEVGQFLFLLGFRIPGYPLITPHGDSKRVRCLASFVSRARSAHYPSWGFETPPRATSFYEFIVSLPLMGIRNSVPAAGMRVENSLITPHGDSKRLRARVRLYLAVENLITPHGDSKP